MATFNGAPYLRQQLQSILDQTTADWTLLIRDDGSSDNTVEIIKSFSDKDERISIIENVSENLCGAAQNFNSLIAAGLESNSEIFFFCDQDDIWRPKKLRIQTEPFFSGTVDSDRLLVYSDLAVVDESLGIIHPSMNKFMKLGSTSNPPFNSLLTRNIVTGCSMACSRQLLECAFPIPKEAIMHDWWLALVASGTGQIKFLDRSLVDYRQHDFNAIGATGFWTMLNPFGRVWENWRQGNREFLSTFTQASALLRHAQDSPAKWSNRNIETMKIYCSLLGVSVRKRISVSVDMGYRRGSFLLKLPYYLRLITMPREVDQRGDSSES